MALALKLQSSFSWVDPNLKLQKSCPKILFLQVDIKMNILLILKYKANQGASLLLLKMPRVNLCGWKS